MTKEDKGDILLTPGEVAKIFKVNPKTVTRWALTGRIPFVLTPGGHKRFRTSEINKFLDADPNGCYTLADGSCVSPGPCMHT